MFFIFRLECCEKVTISSDSTSFASFNAFGIGTYTKHSVDNRDRIVYKYTDPVLANYGFGPFVLYYEGPNEGGRQNWVVCTYQLYLINLKFFEYYLAQILNHI